MPTTIAVAGGTRGMGLAIVHELKRLPHLYSVKILSRKANATQARELGVEIITIDYSSIEGITKVLEDEGVRTLIPNVFIAHGVMPSQRNLIYAAEASSVTKRFVPSTFETPYDEAMAAVLYTGTYKLDIERVLLMTKSLEWTRFNNGFFLDYYFSSKVKTFLTPGKYVVDLDSKKAIIPGNGNVPVSFTHTLDVARFVVASLSLPLWPSRLYMSGDYVTWDQFVDLAEKASGTSFQREYNDLEQLKSGDITRFKQLDGWVVLYEYWPKTMAERLPSAIQYFMGSGLVD
ncbi:Oxidoreductase BOA1 [Paramyrothecium foliicola]|nr:Oxidoreductase BOA1 [Paramyrothecium foliicola]